MPTATEHMGDIVMRGSRLSAHVVTNITEAGVTMGVDQTTELTVSLVDPDLKLSHSGLFTLGMAIDYQDLRMEAAVIEQKPGPAGTGALTISGRSLGVQKLKLRQGSQGGVMRNASPTQFVQAECKAVGLKCVAQPTGTLPQVARDVAPSGSSQADIPKYNRPSSWTTFQRLAQESGFLMFEVAGTVYFGKPSWLIKYAPEVHLSWDKDFLGVPTSRMSRDNIYPAEVTFDVPWTFSSQMRPGKAVRIANLPMFSGLYLITDVSFSLAGEGPVTVTARTPHDPVPTQTTDATVYQGKGQYKSLADSAIKAGFKGEKLVIAIAIALAESSGNAGARNRNSNGTIDLGLWQINSIHNNYDAELLLDPDYNAKAAYDLSDGGNNWKPWATYWEHPWDRGPGGPTAPFQRYMATARGAVTSFQSQSLAVTGSRQVNDFVGKVQAQVGDLYIYGAEASLTDPDPDAFDCSELVQWGCAQVGITIPDGSYNQQAYCQRKGTIIPVSEAIKTRGALLFRPGHVAISLGDGRTVEARGRAYGVVNYIAGTRFTVGARIPGMAY